MFERLNQSLVPRSSSPLGRRLAMYQATSRRPAINTAGYFRACRPNSEPEAIEDGVPGNSVHEQQGCYVDGSKVWQPVAEPKCNSSIFKRARTLSTECGRTEVPARMKIDCRRDHPPGIPLAAIQNHRWEKLSPTNLPLWGNAGSATKIRLNLTYECSVHVPLGHCERVSTSSE